MLERFRARLRTSGLIAPGDSVLVGYSGGADSTCLLHLLKGAGVDVAGGHLHHGQRAEAERELKLCEAFCAELGIPFVSGHADVPRMSAELKIGLEEAGRDARYAFLTNAAFRLSCNLIATAHTRSDLIETVLLNMTRGCGLHGLVGIPERRDNIVRPLLSFSRDETRAYCTERGFWFHDDPANEDVSFSRARIRHRVLKELRTINPGLDHAIERMVGVVAEEDRFLSGMAVSALAGCEFSLNGQLRFLTIDCEVAFTRAGLTALPAALFKRGIRLAAEALGGNLDFAQTEAVSEGVLGGGKGSVTAEEGKVAVEWSPDLVHLRQLAPDVPFRYGLTVPGETSSNEFGWKVEAFASDAIRKSGRTDMTVFLDPSNVSGQLYFRTAKAGDSMQPLGFGGHRKLADLLSESKLTKAAKARLPIICDMVGPVWAPGICLDARVVAESGSRNGLVLRFGPSIAAEGHNDGNAT